MVQFGPLGYIVYSIVYQIQCQGCYDTRKAPILWIMVLPKINHQALILSTRVAFYHSLMRLQWRPFLAFVVRLGTSVITGIFVVVAETAWVISFICVVLDGSLPIIGGSGVRVLFYISGYVGQCELPLAPLGGHTWLVLCPPLKVAYCPFVQVSICSSSKIDD